MSEFEHDQVGENKQAVLSDDQQTGIIVAHLNKYMTGGDPTGLRPFNRDSWKTHTHPSRFIIVEQLLKALKDKKYQGNESEKKTEFSPTTALHIAKEQLKDEQSNLKNQKIYWYRQSGLFNALLEAYREITQQQLSEKGFYELNPNNSQEKTILQRELEDLRGLNKTDCQDNIRQELEQLAQHNRKPFANKLTQVLTRYGKLGSQVDDHKDRWFSLRNRGRWSMAQGDWCGLGKGKFLQQRVAAKQVLLKAQQLLNEDNKLTLQIGGNDYTSLFQEQKKMDEFQSQQPVTPAQYAQCACLEAASKIGTFGMTGRWGSYFNSELRKMFVELGGTEAVFNQFTSHFGTGDGYSNRYEAAIEAAAQEKSPAALEHTV